MTSAESEIARQQAPEGAAIEQGSDDSGGRSQTRYYLALFQSGLRDDPVGSLNRRVLHVVEDRIENTIGTPPTETVIDIWLDSPGGDANVAYKLFLLLRSRCCQLRAVVPDYAKSAATLLTLGADRIFMAAAAELGPLDVQIEHPDKEGRVISGLDVADALAFLAGYAADYTIAAGADILRYTNLPRAAVLREVARFSALLLKPVMDKLDPHLIHKAANELNIAKRYAELMLDGRNLTVTEKESTPNSRKLAHLLVNDYPAHEFVIGRDEARSLGLPIAEAESYERWAAVKGLHRRYQEELFAGRAPASVTDVWSESDVTRLFDDAQKGSEPSEFPNRNGPAEHCGVTMKEECDATE